MANNLTWNVSAEVLTLVGKWNPEVSISDIDKALVGKVRAELDRLSFASRKGDAKLSIQPDFSVRYSDGQEAKATAEWKPFGALIRYSGQWDKFRKEFKGSKLAELPATEEFETLKLWVKSLRPRGETKAKEEEKETANA